MKTVSQEEINNLLTEFLDHEAYDIKYLRGPAEKDQTKAVETLKSLGFEVFDHTITTNKNEFTIYYRRKRP